MSRVQLDALAWGWVADVHGEAQAGVSVSLANLDGSAATHYSAVTGGTSSTATLTTKADGTLTLDGTNPRFVESGSYTMTAGGQSRRVEASSGLAERGIPLSALNYLTTAYTARDSSVIIDLAAAVADMEATGRALYFPGDLYCTPAAKNVVLNSATTSYTYRFFGDGIHSRIYLPSGMADGDFVLRANEDAAGTRVTDNYLSHLRHFFDDLYVVGTASPNGGFLSATQRSFSARRVQVYGLKRGFRTTGYCDAVRLESIRAEAITSGGWAYEQTTAGDGLTVDGFFTYACAGIKLVGCHGAHLRGMIGGWHRFDSSDVTVSQAHLEGDGTNDTNPLITCKNTRLHIPDGELWTNKWRPAISIDDTASPIGGPSRLKLGKALRFLQRLDVPGGNPSATGVPANHHDSTQGVAVYLAALDHRTEIEFEGVRQDYVGQTVSNVGDFAVESGAIKVTAADGTIDTTVNGRPPLLLGHVVIKSFAGTWEVNPAAPIGALRMTRRATAGVTLAAAVENTPAWATNQANGTYYYRAWTRDAENLTTDAAAEVNVTVSGGSPNVKVTVGNIVGPAAVRILRGTSAGVYTHWIEFVTTNNAVILHDQGTTMAGQTWSTTGVPAVAANNDTRDGYVHRGSARRIMYGSVVPATGTWIQGDIIINTGVAAGGSFGWICVTGGTAGTWKALPNVAA